jgi:hypothetical protein
MDFPLFTPTGLIFILLMILATSSIKVNDCLKNKRNLFKSIIICISLGTVNWTVAILFILGVSSLGRYIVELYYIPLYLQWAYFIFCFLSGFALVSQTYIFLNKFYLNFLTKGIYSFKRKQKNAWE